MTVALCEALRTSIYPEMHPVAQAWCTAAVLQDGSVAKTVTQV